MFLSPKKFFQAFVPADADVETHSQGVLLFIRYLFAVRFTLHASVLVDRCSKHCSSAVVVIRKCKYMVFQQISP